VGFIATLSINDTGRYADYSSSGCCSVKCQYTECRGALSSCRNPQNPYLCQRPRVDGPPEVNFRGARILHPYVPVVGDTVNSSGFAEDFRHPGIEPAVIFLELPEDLERHVDLDPIAN
jgi:hypothetical protein